MATTKIPVREVLVSAQHGDPKNRPQETCKSVSEQIFDLEEIPGASSVI